MRAIKEKQIGTSGIGFEIYGMGRSELMNGKLPADAILHADLSEALARSAQFSVDVVRASRGEDPRWKLVSLMFHSGLLKVTLFDTECRWGFGQREMTVLTPISGDFSFTVTVPNRQFAVPDTYEVKGFRNGPLDEEGDRLAMTILESINGRVESFSRFVWRGATGYFKHSWLRW